MSLLHIDIVSLLSRCSPSTLDGGTFAALTVPPVRVTTANIKPDFPVGTIRAFWQLGVKHQTGIAPTLRVNVSRLAD